MLPRNGSVGVIRGFGGTSWRRPISKVPGLLTTFSDQGKPKKESRDKKSQERRRNPGAQAVYIAALSSPAQPSCAKTLPHFHPAAPGTPPTNRLLARTPQDKHSRR